MGAIACYAAWGIRRGLIEGELPPLFAQDAGLGTGLGTGLAAGLGTGLGAGVGAADGLGGPWVSEPLIMLALPMLLVSLWGFGLYRPQRDRALLAEAAQTFKGCFTTVVGLIVVLWAIGPRLAGGWAGERSTVLFGHSIDAGRLQLILLAILLPTLLITHRACFRLALRAIRRRGWNLRHVLVIGTGRLGRIACRTLDRNSWTGLHVAAFLHHADQMPERAAAQLPPLANEGVGLHPCVLDRPVLGALIDLEQVLEEHQPDAVYLALPASRATAMPALLRRLERFTIDVRIIPDVHPRYMPQSMVVSDLEGMPILSVRESPMTGVPGLLKSAFDILGALIAIVLFSPLMLAVAVAVRCSGKGPIIFKQRRVSLGGEVFNIYKFRTMRCEEEPQEGAGWTKRNDPRVTRIGKVLRRTSLDELPQLLNVLLGDMSLVGPRPERPELIEQFREDWRGYMLRQHVKAGITGWAQVNGLRGDTSLRKRLQLDLFYIRHWSLGFDCKILWLTLFRGFFHRNAH